MKFNRDLQRLKNAKSGYNSAIDIIASKVQSVCDFEIYLDDVPGDGWCFGSDVNGSPLYMSMSSVIEVVEKTGKFTKDDWEPFG
ncbi:hypothetical protein [Phaeocystidibacter marisrubri]|uniref:Uncharacterized protein n=1 Tax=Phaeocystidibacter marisrubri TaxID=1577780 RepID=A0A6L3ZCJ6_9FLAO|nr:hypothetical protein [Phaeocystidibacter marisrubri]KAB2815014.1 hypothetical protein F8C82_14625 [Phaeocystidibacter marisrubri]GGH78049.1 hypothetical protein GCM10011318_28740 [Phaeocystidibacter marisrubri]